MLAVAYLTSNYPALLRSDSQLMGAALPPVPLPGVTVSHLLTADPRHYPDLLACPVGPRDIASEQTQQKTLLRTVPLLLRAYLLLWERGGDHIENTKSCVVSVLFPSNSCLWWHPNPGFQQICYSVIILIAARGSLCHFGKCVDTMALRR
jgi:hypothetical protein